MFNSWLDPRGIEGFKCRERENESNEAWDGKLAGMLAILVLSTMQEPAPVNAMASASQDCRGGLRGGCFMCDAEDEEGTPCLFFHL